MNMMRTYLWSKPSGVVGHQGVYRSASGSLLHHAAQIEVSYLDPPVTVYQHVGRLQVSVQNWGVVGMQMQHTLHAITQPSSTHTG